MSEASEHHDHDHDHAPPPPGAPRRPFGGRRRLVNAVDVRFAAIFSLHTFDAGELTIRRGDVLVVDSARGPVLGTAAGPVERRVLPTQEIRRVVRKATESDKQAWAENESLRRAALRAAAIELRALRLPLKVVQVEYTLDRSRAIFYFSSDEKPEFRGLARNLAQRLNVRVDLRQVGVRDGAGMIGGIGPCGHELCCSAFLRHFATISMRFAKDQGLTLNPTRITGMCGRLKCCLVYEQAVYKELRQFAPRAKVGVLTPQGPGNILEVDSLARRVLVSMHAGALATFHLRDCVVLDQRLSPQEIEATMSRAEDVLARQRQKRGGVVTESRKGPTRAGAADLAGDEYIWDATSADSDALKVDGQTEAGEGSKRRTVRLRADAGGGQRPRRGDGPTRDGRPRRDGRPARPEAAGDAAKVQEASQGAPGAAEGEARRKKRRRKKKPGGDGAQGGTIEATGQGAGTGAQPQQRRPQQPPAETGAGGDGAQGEGGAARKKRRRRRGGRGGGGGGAEGGEAAGGGGGDE